MIVTVKKVSINYKPFFLALKLIISFPRTEFGTDFLLST